MFNETMTDHQPGLRCPQCDGFTIWKTESHPYVCGSCGWKTKKGKPAAYTCQSDGCTKPAEYEFEYPRWGEDDDGSTELLCYDHAKESGFCLGCGHFSAGTEDFDFSEIEGYCGQCVEELRYESGEYDDEDDWDDYDGYDPY